MKTCKKCGQIVHTIRRRGSLLVVNPSVRRVVTPKGEIIDAYIPHWDTCPKAEKVRADLPPELTSDATKQLHLPLKGEKHV